MPPAASFHLNPPPPSLHCSTNPRPRSSLVVCRCGNAPLKRAWAPPLRLSATWQGFRAVEGLRNHEKGGILSGFSQEEKRKEDDGSESEVENEERLNEKKPESAVANSSDRVVYRRQKGAAAANVDLLMILGVGSRNLRKLVDKGFEEVAQLKQLYRDKIKMKGF